MIEFSPRTLKVLKTAVSETFMIPISEIPRMLYHGFVLSCIISGFWLLDSLKDPILAHTIGIEYQPIAKFFSVISTLLVVCIYDYFTSIVTKPILFHLVAWTYGLIFMIISAVLASPTYGLTSTEHGPHRMIGWLSYFSIESYGSLMAALFWSFTNSVMDLDEAKGNNSLRICVSTLNL